MAIFLTTKCTEFEPTRVTICDWSRNPPCSESIKGNIKRNIDIRGNYG
jgi:hypothetical protein